MISKPFSQIPPAQRPDEARCKKELKKTHLSGVFVFEEWQKGAAYTS